MTPNYNYQGLDSKVFTLPMTPRPLIHAPKIKNACVCPLFHKKKTYNFLIQYQFIQNFTPFIIFNIYNFLRLKPILVGNKTTHRIPILAGNKTTFGMVLPKQKRENIQPMRAANSRCISQEGRAISRRMGWHTPGPHKTCLPILITSPKPQYSQR